MFRGSELGRRSEVIAWLALESAPRRAQCSAYTTLPCILCFLLGCVWLRLAMLSVSFRAKRTAVSHRPFHSPRWNLLALDTICLTLPRRLHGISSAGRNCATTSRMCAAKESRGYLSARSSTRCILAANCSIASPLGITLGMRTSRSSKRSSVSNKSLRKAKEPDLVSKSTRTPGRE